MSEPILSVRELCVYFEVSGDGWFGARKVLRAVDGVSFDLARSETLGIVGESGCGKSTLARAVLGLVRVTSGEVRFAGQDLARLDSEKMREQRRHLQIIFQDPLSSLDPRMNVGQIIGEPLRSFFPRMTQEERQAKVVEMMQHVGLLPEQINRYPHEFSGGQAQRIGIARALILHPEVVVCDEPVSALDVSIKAQIVNLLADLQAGVRRVAAVYRARPGFGAPREPSRDGALSGQGDGTGSVGRNLSRAAPSLHAGADPGYSARGPEARARQSGKTSRRRASVADCAAVRLRVSDAVSLRS